MTWVYLDDQFPTHPKVALAGGDAAWLFVCSLCYVRQHGTQGLIPKTMVGRLSDRRGAKKLAERLVEVVLWEDQGEHYLIHDYHEWNRSASSRSEAGRKAANARWSKKDTNGNADASDPHDDRIESADASTCTIPSPVPSPLEPPPTELQPDRIERVDGAVRAAAVILGEAVGRTDGAYIGGIEKRLKRTHAAELHRQAHDGAETDTLTAWLIEAETVEHPTESTAAAQAARIDRPDCPDCLGAGVIELEDGSATDCGCKRSVA